MSNSCCAQWGLHDCWTYAFGEGYKRPEWLAPATSEQHAIRLAKQRCGSVHAAWAECLRASGKFEQMGSDCKLRPGDVILCSTSMKPRGALEFEQVREDLAKVENDYNIYKRTPCGIEAVKVLRTHSVWRAK